MLAELVFLAVATVPPSTEPLPLSEQPAWDVTDDPETCPEGTTGWVPAGSDYEAGIWTDPEGNLIGAARFEDECVVLITDDMAPQMPSPEDLEHDVTEVRIIDDQPTVVTFDTSAPTYDAPEGQLPLTR